jgi:hypothetical protein
MFLPKLSLHHQNDNKSQWGGHHFVRAESKSSQIGNIVVRKERLDR